jgi:hypothetical protein
MSFNWDGTGTGETTLPAGIYYYLISAYTNGLGLGGGTNGGGGDPPPPDEASPGSSGVSTPGMETVQLPPAPVPFFYGRDADGNEITTMEVPVPSSTSEESAVLAGGVHPDGAPSPASSQSAPSAPVRPPTAPVRGTLGTFGVAYQTYSGNGGAPYSLNAPNSGCIPDFNDPLQLNGLEGNQPSKYYPLTYVSALANNFVDAMQGYGWKQGFSTLVDDKLTAQSLQGIVNPFNDVDLGLLLLHGAYGTSEDCNGGVNCMQMYFPITSGSGAQYVSMSAMDFGGPTTNGLKWMAIFACHSLYHVNWQSMQSQRVYPYNGNLHLLLGSDTDCYDALGLTTYWAAYMQHGIKNGTYGPLTIQNAWYQAAAYAYQNSGPTYPTIVFAVAGDAACLGDSLQTNSTPSGTWTYTTQQVYPPQ